MGGSLGRAKFGNFGSSFLWNWQFGASFSENVGNSTRVQNKEALPQKHAGCEKLRHHFQARSSYKTLKFQTQTGSTHRNYFQSLQPTKHTAATQDRQAKALGLHLFSVLSQSNKSSQVSTSWQVSLHLSAASFSQAFLAKQNYKLAPQRTLAHLRCAIPTTPTSGAFLTLRFSSLRPEQN